MAQIFKVAVLLGVFLLLEVPNSKAELKISAFNIRVFGQAKMEDQNVVDILIQVFIFKKIC